MSKKRCREKIVDRITNKKRQCKLNHQKDSKYCYVHRDSKQEDKPLITICKFYIAPRPENTETKVKTKVKTEPTKIVKSELDETEKKVKSELDETIDETGETDKCDSDANAILDDEDDFLEKPGVCCFCGGDCHPCSQACGTCKRMLSFGYL